MFGTAHNFRSLGSEQPFQSAVDAIPPSRTSGFRNLDSEQPF